LIQFRTCGTTENGKVGAVRGWLNRGGVPFAGRGILVQQKKGKKRVEMGGKFATSFSKKIGGLDGKKEVKENGIVVKAQNWVGVEGWSVS